MPPGIQITLSVKDDGTATIQQVSGQIQGLARTTASASKEQATALESLRGHWLAITAATAGVTLALHRVWAAAKQGAEFEESLDRLNRQAGDFHTNAEQMVADLKRVTAGQLSAADAVRLSSRALAIGADPEQILVFAQAAEALGDVLGTDLKSAYDQVLQAIATGRGQILANIGVYVDLEAETEKLAQATGRHADQVTKQERAMLAAKAIAEQAGPALAKLSDGTQSAADRFAAMEAKIDDARTSLGRLAAEVAVAFIDQLDPDDGILKAFNPASLVSSFRAGRRNFQAVFDDLVTFQDPEHRARQEALGHGIVQEALGRRIVEETKLLLAQRAAAAASTEEAAGFDIVTQAIARYQALSKQAALATDLLTQRMQAAQATMTSAKAGLATLEQRRFADELAGQGGVMGQTDFLRRSALGTSDPAALERMALQARALRGAAAQETSSLTEAENRLLAMEQQRAEASRATVLGSYQEVQARRASLAALDEQVSQQQALVEIMRAGGTGAAEAVDDLVRAIETRLSSAWETSGARAQEEFETLSFLLKDGKLSAEEYTDILQHGLRGAADAARLARNEIVQVNSALADLPKVGLLVAQLAAGVLPDTSGARGDGFGGSFSTRRDEQFSDISTFNQITGQDFFVTPGGAQQEQTGLAVLNNVLAGRDPLFGLVPGAGSPPYVGIDAGGGGDSGGRSLTSLTGFGAERGFIEGGSFDLNPGGLGDIGGFAKGGVAWEPQLARVAEDEPELIVPFSRLRRRGSGGGVVVHMPVTFNLSGPSQPDPEALRQAARLLAREVHMTLEARR